MNRIAKDRITPCLSYICAGECKKGRQNIIDAVKSVNKKKQELEKIKKRNIISGGFGMDFWLVDVKSTVNVNGVDVAFDYINTYLSLSEAIKEAKLLSENDDILEVSVHKWILNEDGMQEHSEDDDSIPYHFLNRNHREFK